MNRGFWFPKATTPPPPPPPAPPLPPQGEGAKTVGERLVERLRVMARLTGRDDDADTAAEAAREITRLRLTDAEREAIVLFAALNWTSVRWSKVEKNAATLRKLLERLT